MLLIASLEVCMPDGLPLQTSKLEKLVIHNLTDIIEISQSWLIYLLWYGVQWDLSATTFLWTDHNLQFPVSIKGECKGQHSWYTYLSLLSVLSSVTIAMIAILYIWSETLSGFTTFLYTQPVRGTR